MGHEAGVLIGCARISSFARDVVDRFSMLALITSNHIHRLLDQVEIEILVAKAWCKIKISVYKRLRASVK